MFLIFDLNLWYLFHVYGILVVRIVLSYRKYLNYNVSIEMIYRMH